ncbi:hypothetical protein ACOMHN_020866 [Nucella lapillus]
MRSRSISTRSTVTSIRAMNGQARVVRNPQQPASLDPARREAKSPSSTTSVPVVSKASVSGEHSKSTHPTESGVVDAVADHKVISTLCCCISTLEKTVEQQKSNVAASYQDGCSHDYPRNTDRLLSCCCTYLR